MKHRAPWKCSLASLWRTTDRKEDFLQTLTGSQLFLVLKPGTKGQSQEPLLWLEKGNTHGNPTLTSARSSRWARPLPVTGRVGAVFIKKYRRERFLIESYVSYLKNWGGVLGKENALRAFFFPQDNVYNARVNFYQWVNECPVVLQLVAIYYL